MVYLTGDTHGDFRRIKQFCFKVTPTLDDTLIILGDASFNYYANYRDEKAKIYATWVRLLAFM